MTQKLEFVPPNPDFLAIARLYLEKYEILNDEDRRLYRGMLLLMANPPIIVQKDKIRAEDVTFRTGVYVSDPKNDFPVVGFKEPEEKPDLISIANKLMATPDWRSADLYHALLEAFRMGEVFNTKVRTGEAFNAKASK